MSGAWDIPHEHNANSTTGENYQRGKESVRRQLIPFLEEKSKEIANLRTAVLRMNMHRDIVCAGDTKCDSSDCALISHNHILFTTREARDDWAALIAVLQGELE